MTILCNKHQKQQDDNPQYTYYLTNFSSISRHDNWYGKHHQHRIYCPFLKSTVDTSEGVPRSWAPVGDPLSHRRIRGRRLPPPLSFHTIRTARHDPATQAHNPSPSANSPVTLLPPPPTSPASPSASSPVTLLLPPPPPHLSAPLPAAQ